MLFIHQLIPSDSALMAVIIPLLQMRKLKEKCQFFSKSYDWVAGIPVSVKGGGRLAEQCHQRVIKGTGKKGRWASLTLGVDGKAVVCLSRALKYPKNTVS